ncbi:hypothetical protein LBMAG48_27340 [Phycisphaerae bacterium]|nr:hypothetical protein LBMAG48_27340 [Phycisphaerae bacterium]
MDEVEPKSHNEETAPTTPASDEYDPDKDDYVPLTREDFGEDGQFFANIFFEFREEMEERDRREQAERLNVRDS